MISVENVEIVSRYNVAEEVLSVYNSKPLCFGLKDKIEETLDIDGPCVVVIKSDNKYALVNQEGILLTEYWVDYIDHFHCGFASVRLKGKYNYINTEGKYLSEQWFNYADKFDENHRVARVQLEGKYNLIDTEGNILSPIWFLFIQKFNGDIAWACTKDKDNFINNKGELLFEQWFDCAEYYYNEDIYAIQIGKKWNFINNKGKVISEQWFDYVYKFSEDFGRVSLNDKWNFINKEGEVLSDQWFDDVLSFENGVGVVQLNEQWNFIDKDGRFVYDDWFDDNDERYINNIHERLVTDYSDYEYDYENVFEEDGFYYC